MQIAYTDLSRFRPEERDLLWKAASPQRQIRAAGYRKPERKLCCLAADALLRYAVGCAGLPTPFVVETAPGGKPYIKGGEPFCFSLSHSAHCTAIAWSSGEIGVDVEQIRRMTRLESLARRCFTVDEQSYLFAPEGDMIQRFFALWTAKESYVKYLGTGLRTPLNSFSVCAMDRPRFTSHLLDGGYCLTVCADEAGAAPVSLAPEQLCSAI